MSYAAIVAKIQVRPHPNADKLALGLVAGHQVIVSKETQDGEVGVFFPTDGALSHEMCLNNDLYNNAARTALGLFPSEKPGFFSENRRVRAQNFRGVKSDGFWVPLSYLSWASPDSSAAACLEEGCTCHGLKEGGQFIEFNGKLICEKYYTPATRRAMASGSKAARQRREVLMFPKHTDTGQFKYQSHHIPDDAVIWITEKLHGTSGRYGHVLDELPRTWWQKLLRLPATKKKWTYLNGSRNVVLEKAKGPDFYGTTDFRYNVVNGLTLHKGEVLYFEIVGFTGPGAPIMERQDTTKLKDKAIEQQYGKTMTYSYGCADGEHKLYVYKIVQMNEDGHGVELSYPQMVQRAGELGLNTAPLLAGPIIAPSAWQEPTFVDLVNMHTAGRSTLDSSHLREGCVVRVESPTTGVIHLKEKSFEFKVLEGIVKDRDTYVDLEEAA